MLPEAYSVRPLTDNCNLKQYPEGKRSMMENGLWHSPECVLPKGSRQNWTCAWIPAHPLSCQCKAAFAGSAQTSARQWPQHCRTLTHIFLYPPLNPAGRRSNIFHIKRWAPIRDQPSGTPAEISYHVMKQLMERQKLLKIKIGLTSVYYFKCNHTDEGNSLPTLHKLIASRPKHIS